MMHPHATTRTSALPAAPGDASRVVGTLDHWMAADWADGLQIDELTALDKVVVRTRNTHYEVLVLGGREGEVLVRGGRYFPEFTHARLAGATAGGSVLKLMGIYAGLCLELVHDGRRIVTSPVASVGLVPVRDVQA